jgi:hypothetical protein
MTMNQLTSVAGIVSYLPFSHFRINMSSTFMLLFEKKLCTYRKPLHPFDHLIRQFLNNTTGNWELRAAKAGQERVDIASGHATFVDTPRYSSA